MSMFVRKLPRLVTWKDYGITKKRLKELKTMCCLPENAYQSCCAARRASEIISEYILLSVRENLSYDDLEYNSGLGRIPIGRTDFYGYRRLFYHYFDTLMKGEKIMEKYEIKKKKISNSDYFVNEISIDRDKSGDYIVEVKSVNLRSGNVSKASLRSSDVLFISELINLICNEQPPRKGTRESGFIIDLCGFLTGDIAENA